MNALVWIFVLLFIKNVLLVRGYFLDISSRFKYRHRDTDFQDSIKTYRQKPSRDIDIIANHRELSDSHGGNAERFAQEESLSNGMLPNANETDFAQLLEKLLFLSRDLKGNSWKHILKLSELDDDEDYDAGQPYDDGDRLNWSEVDDEDFDRDMAPIIVVLLTSQQLINDGKANIREHRTHLNKLKDNKPRLNKKDHGKITYIVKAKCTRGQYYRSDPCNVCYCTKNRLHCTKVKCTLEKAELGEGSDSLDESSNRFYKKLRQAATECSPGVHTVVKDGNDHCPCTCIMPSVMYCPMCPSVGKLVVPRKNTTVPEIHHKKP